MGGSVVGEGVVMGGSVVGEGVVMGGSVVGEGVGEGDGASVPVKMVRLRILAAAASNQGSLA